jgi:large subunit ribosomal protein L15
MMELNNLKPASGTVKQGKRKARGQGSGKGGTSTRGHKGAKSRAGYSNKRNYEGGQTPLQMRFPKRGFKNPFRVAYAVFNLDRLEEISKKFKATTITPEFLVENGLAGKNDLVKILAKGNLESKLEVSAHKFSNSAKEAIESAGGTATVV